MQRPAFRVAATVPDRSPRGQAIGACVARSSASDGFSLLELLVAFIVAGSILAAALSGLGNLRRLYGSRGAAREVYGQLQKMRMQAVSENNRYRFLLVGGSNHQYKLHDDNNGDASETGETVTTYDIQAGYPGTTLTVPTTITFSPNGTAPNSGTVTVVHPGGTSTVEVTPAGRIRIL